MGHRGPGSTRYSEELAARKYSTLEGYGILLQHSCLENPLSDRESGQATVYRVSKSQTGLKQP